MWIRTAWVFTVLVIPGGFLLLLAFLWARALLRASEKAKATTPGTGVHLRDVFAEVHFRDLLKEARGSL